MACKPLFSMEKYNKSQCEFTDSGSRLKAQGFKAQPIGVDDTRPLLVRGTGGVAAVGTGQHGLFSSKNGGTSFENPACPGMFPGMFPGLSLAVNVRLCTSLHCKLMIYQ